jgi:hypothetical protein
VAALGPAYPRLERICLKRMTVSDDDLALVANSFPFFKELSLVCCDGFSTVGLAVIAERCRYVALALSFCMFCCTRALNLSGLACGIQRSILPAFLAFGGYHTMPFVHLFNPSCTTQFRLI